MSTGQPPPIPVGSLLGVNADGTTIYPPTAYLSRNPTIYEPRPRVPINAARFLDTVTDDSDDSTANDPLQAPLNNQVSPPPSQFSPGSNASPEPRQRTVTFALDSQYIGDQRAHSESVVPPLTRRERRSSLRRSASATEAPRVDSVSNNPTGTRNSRRRSQSRRHAEHSPARMATFTPHNWNNTIVHAHCYPEWLTWPNHQAPIPDWLRYPEAWMPPLLSSDSDDNDNSPIPVPRPPPQQDPPSYDFRPNAYSSQNNDRHVAPLLRPNSHQEKRVYDFRPSSPIQDAWQTPAWTSQVFSNSLSPDVFDFRPEAQRPIRTPAWANPQWDLSWIQKSPNMLQKPCSDKEKGQRVHRRRKRRSLFAPLPDRSPFDDCKKKRPRTWRPDYTPLSKVGLGSRIRTLNFVNGPNITAQPHVQINALLKIMPKRYYSIYWDTRKRPFDEAIPDLMALGRPANNVDVLQLATTPPLYHMRMWHKRLPVYVDINATMPNGITIMDILAQLYEKLMEFFRSRDYECEDLDASDRELVAQAHEFRTLPVGHMDGMRWVDFLGFRYSFVGIVQSKNGFFEFKTTDAPQDFEM